MTWKDEIIDNVDALFTRLHSLYEKDELVAYRGQSDKNWDLKTSLDRILDENTDYAVRIGEEFAILDKFYVRARKFLGVNEAKRLDQLLVNNKISALTVLQHYRAPTRMLDWTLSSWIALYFAAIEHHDKDGAIWWFNQKAFEDEVGQRWADYGLKHDRRWPHQVNLNDTAFNSDGPLWITKLHCALPFHRIEVQQGFFTVAGRLGFEHGALIANILGEGQFARIVIPASAKQEILDRLFNMGIHSRTLDYPGADIVGKDLTLDLKDTHNRSSEDRGH